MARSTLVPSAPAVAFDQIAPGVVGLRVLLVNLFSVTAADGSWVLVDAGLPFSTSRILEWVAQIHGEGSRPACILLTHGHFDHVGALAQLADRWDVPVYAHELELPYVTGRSSYPPPDPFVGGGVMAVASPLYPRGPIDLTPRVRPLPRNGEVPGLDGWRWVHTSGHTAGHVSFFREADRLLLAGDAFVTTKQESLLAVLTQKKEMHGPPAYYTSDWGQAYGSVVELAALEPQVVACGHGLPLAGPAVQSDLHQLARRFEEVALPEQGRYRQQPAVVGPQGVVSLPPPINVPLAYWATIAAIGGVVWWMFARSRRSGG